MKEFHHTMKTHIIIVSLCSDFHKSIFINQLLYDTLVLTNLQGENKMRYYYNRSNQRKRRRIDWIIDIVCILICFTPYLFYNLFSSSFRGDLYFPMMLSTTRATSYSILVYAALNFTAFYPQLVMLFVTIDDSNREELVVIFNNMLNLIKVIAIPSLAILTPIYTFFHFPMPLLVIPLILVTIVIIRYYIAEMKKVNQYQ